MDTVVNPTAEQVAEFCDYMKASLLDAIKRGGLVEISVGQTIEPVQWPDYSGLRPDYIYVGGEYVAKFRERGM